MAHFRPIDPSSPAGSCPLRSESDRRPALHENAAKCHYRKSSLYSIILSARTSNAWGHRHAHRLSGLEVDHRLELSRHLDRDVGDLDAAREALDGLSGEKVSGWDLAHPRTERKRKAPSVSVASRARRNNGIQLQYSTCLTGARYCGARLLLPRNFAAL
jgi:hypothetical protein